jgi:hypothetical protein
VRRVALGLAAIAGSVLISACGGPSQAGSAAIVGGQSVSLSDVQAQVVSALARTDQINQLSQRGVGPEDIARDVVTRAILHDLLAKRAAAENLSVSDATVDAAIAAQGGPDAVAQTTLGSPDDVRVRVRDNLLSAQLGSRIAGGLAVKADLLGTTSRPDAYAKAATLAKGGAPAEALFGDPNSSVKDQTFSAVTRPDAASSVLFGVPVGTVGTFQPDPQNATWFVFRVTQRITNAPVDQAALSQISQDELSAIGERSLQPDAEAAGIQVNPRYGVWDPVQQRVVGPDQVAGEILPAAH